MDRETHRLAARLGQQALEARARAEAVAQHVRLADPDLLEEVLKNRELADQPDDGRGIGRSGVANGDGRHGIQSRWGSSAPGPAARCGRGAARSDGGYSFVTVSPTVTTPRSTILA